MKKVIAGAMTILLTILGVIGLSLSAITPASAGQPNGDKQIICSANNGVNGYTSNNVDKASIVLGGHGSSGVNAGDIIPPFLYNFDGGPAESYPGQNWDAPENRVIYNNGCHPTGTSLTPVLPVLPVVPVATCSNQNPTLTIPAQPQGVTVSSSYTPETKTFEVLFGKPENTKSKTYSFPEGFVNPVVLVTVPAGPGDIYWDTTANNGAGGCNLPNTGLFGLSDELTYAGGALLALGLVFVVGNAVIRRRNT